MTRERARRLLEMESKWSKCGNGAPGRGPTQNNGHCRKQKKSRAHAQRLQKLKELAR